ncbi:hypothetical protein [Janthinobacterium fluminis]|uniref:Uncharacterized protein n=1 Tax=Janthinobacterium fluminis TaxID=2987524 RepID=A0ABT5K0W7_9BURK|nr:hypothetical protein [Janthinobacterium fluminis]MDC8758504.1 hypothetical protein [Janthinobacterium fluminis]
MLAFLLAPAAHAQSPSNPIQLDGVYMYRTGADDLDIIGDAVCFHPDKKQWGRVPRPKNGLPVWFCFANDAEARALLHVPGKEAAIGCGFQARASIEIYGYVIYREQGDYHDTAKLKAVSALSRAKPIACE